MKSVFLVCIFWATFLCAYCQYRWQENNDNRNVILKTVYVPLLHNKGSSNVPFKLSKKERQIVSELNQYLLKHQNNPNIPQNGYYNVQVRHFDSPQELTRNFHLKHQLSPANSYALSPNQDNENNAQEIPYKQISQPVATPEPEYQQPSQTHQQLPQTHQQLPQTHQQPLQMHQQSQRIYQQPQLKHQKIQSIHQQPQSIHLPPQPVHQQSQGVHQKPIHKQPQHVHQQLQHVHQQPQHVHQQRQQVHQQQPQQIHVQSSPLLDTTTQHNYVHNKEQIAQQERTYENAFLPQTSQYESDEDIHDNTRTAHEYQHMAIKYPSANQQNGIEYQNNPTTYNTQSYAVMRTQNALHQPIQNSYEVNVQPQNPLPATSPATLHQPSVPSSTTYQSAQNFQANVQTQSPNTFQAYQAALSQQIFPSEQSSQHQLQHVYAENTHSSIVPVPAKSSNLVPVAISQYQTKVHQPSEDYTTPDSSVRAANPQTEQTHQDVYHSYDPRSMRSHVSPIHSQSNSHTQYASTVPQFRQQHSEGSVDTDHQNPVYHDHSLASIQDDTPSQSYHDVPDPAHETFTANPRLVYTQPPSNFLYPENQQQYTPNQNVVVVYKNPPNAYVQQHQHFDQQSHVQKSQAENQQLLPKVNFKPLYGYSYN